MKRAILVVVCISLAGQYALALDSGPGGTVYWDTVVGNITKFRLYQATVSTSWAGSGVTNFDNLAMLPWNTYAFGGHQNNVEVYSPGKLLVADIYNDTPPSRGYSTTGGNNYNQPWDVLLVDPNVHNATYSAANHNLLTDGSLLSGTWNTSTTTMAMAAPANWGGKTSNGISIVTVSATPTTFNTKINYLYDANNNGAVDNASSEGTQISSGTPYVDTEFGPDKAIYATYSAGVFANHYVKIDRIWMKSNGTAVTEHYFLDDCATSQMVGGGDVAAPGIAVGPGNSLNSKPILYLFTTDNASTRHNAIYALQASTVAGDNTISFSDAGDKMVKIWQSGQAGIDFGGYDTSVYNPQDIEIYVDPENSSKRTLMFCTYYDNKLYGLNLADNGLAIKGTGQVILSSGMPGNSSFFEFDANSVPEPTTMTLLASGALGAVAWWRRRRML